MNQRRRGHRAAGFSLIELLVVIAIVAVLAGLLMPAVSTVRASAQQIACSSQFRQIGMGIMMYTMDWDGGLPPSRYQGCTPTDLVPQGYPLNSLAAWTDSLWVGQYLGSPITRYDSFSVVGGRPRGVLRCPSDRKRIGISNPLSVSYGLNMYVSPYANTAASRDGPFFWPRMTNMNTLRAQDSLLLAAETLESRWYYDTTTAWPASGFWNQASDVPLWGPPGSFPPNVWARHRQKANYLFVDGHVMLKGNLTAEVGAKTVYMRPSDVP